jgi:hypothetical protein
MTEDGLGFELFSVYFGLTCNHNTFRGRYDLWPFCKPYDAEEWWTFMEQPEAIQAAKELTKYLLAVLPNGLSRSAPCRISFQKEKAGFRLLNNGNICGMHLFKGEDEKTPWPFGRLPDWPNHKTRSEAMKATIRLQEYLDKRTAKLAK